MPAIPFPPQSRHSKALAIGTRLAEEIRVLSKHFPEGEDMAMVPEIRQTVMNLHAALLMLPAVDNDGEYHHYTDEVRGKSARLETQVRIAGGLGYLTEEKLQEIATMLDAIHALIEAPRKPRLTLVESP